jgi:hypothetical protein
MYKYTSELRADELGRYGGRPGGRVEGGFRRKSHEDGNRRYRVCRVLPRLPRFKMLADMLRRFPLPDIKFHKEKTKLKFKIKI